MAWVNGKWVDSKVSNDGQVTAPGTGAPGGPADGGPGIAPPTSRPAAGTAVTDFRSGQGTANPWNMAGQVGQPRWKPADWDTKGADYDRGAYDKQYGTFQQNRDARRWLKDNNQNPSGTANYYNNAAYQAHLGGDTQAGMSPMEKWRAQQKAKADAAAAAAAAAPPAEAQPDPVDPGPPVDAPVDPVDPGPDKI